MATANHITAQIDIPLNVTPMDARNLLMAAISEYIGHREHGDAKAYVDRRYPACNYSPEFRDRKLRDVRSNLLAAKHAHQNITIKASYTV